MEPKSIFQLDFYFYNAFVLSLVAKIGVMKITRDEYVFRGHVDQPAARIPKDNNGT